ncbi:MAG: V4R domain-containing protein [Candidatus Nanohaloarchaea archaeon]
MGLGRLEAIEFNPEKEVIRMTVEDSPFVDQFRESDVLQEIDRPIHHMIRGMLVAIGEEIFDDDVEAEETECQFLGDERCLITVRRVSDD